MAWPERVVLFVVVALMVVSAEVGVLLAGKEYRMAGWVAGLFAIASLIFDLWLVLRTIDWTLAGPARRRGDRIVR